MKQIYLYNKIIIWSCIGGILAIWNVFLYQNGVGEITNLYDLAAYITTGSGYGYMALHLSIYPIVCDIIIYIDTMNPEPAILLRMGKKRFLNLYYLIALRNSMLFSLIFTVVLYISTFLRCSEEFWTQLNFIIPCLLYYPAMLVQYTILTYIFVIMFTFTLNREKSIGIAAVIYILLWTLIYTFNVNLFSIQSTVLNEYYMTGINIVKYIARISGQIAAIGIIYLLGHEALSRKDILCDDKG